MNNLIDFAPELGIAFVILCLIFVYFVWREIFDEKYNAQMQAHEDEQDKKALAAYKAQHAKVQVNRMRAGPITERKS